MVFCVNLRYAGSQVVEIAYRPTENVLNLLEAFKSMVNYCIHVGIKRM